MHTTRYMIDDGSDTYADDKPLTREELISRMGYMRDDDPPRPFKVFAWDAAELRRDGATSIRDVTEDLLWAARQAGELSTGLHAYLAGNAKAGGSVMRNGDLSEAGLAIATLLVFALVLMAVAI